MLKDINSWDIAVNITSEDIMKVTCWENVVIVKMFSKAEYSTKSEPKPYSTKKYMLSEASDTTKNLEGKNNVISLFK